MIADPELRQLFKVESAERLQRLDDGLLRLEKTPSDPALLEELFREAHSLKGAARMLGLNDIQTLAHQLEDALGAARKGETALQPAAVVAMNPTLEALRRLVQLEIGEPVAAAGVPTAAPLPAAQERAAESMPAPASAPAAVVRPEAFRIETIRVDPKKLDALLTQAGELTVTKIRMARRLAEIDELLDECEEWGRAAPGGPAAAAEPVARRLACLQDRLLHLRGGAYEDSARLDFIASQIESGIRTLRLLPLSTLFGLFARPVHELARDQHKEVELVIEGGETVADKRVLEEMKDPLMHLLRNAVDHGIETPEQRTQAGKPRSGTIRLKASQTPAGIVLEVSDDGNGLDLEAIQRTALKRGLYRAEELAGMSQAQLQSLILLAGFSTSSFITEVSGRGVGLDVVRNNVERLKGVLQIESVPGQGLTLRAQLPVSLATVRVLVVAAHGQRYALPVEQVQFARKVPLPALYPLEGRPTVSLDGQALGVAWLSGLLGITASAPQPSARGAPATSICVVLTVGEERFGLLVDELIDELEVVLKPQSKLLKRVRNVAGATILDTGDVCLVLNPSDLLKTLRQQFTLAAPAPETEAMAAQKVLLLAEDSITTRTQEKRILEGAGYEVVTAVDGLDAFHKLGTRAFHGLVSDIQMPNMDGLELTEKIRADRKYAELPIILVTSLASEQDQRRGLEAGANAYIAKPSFDQQVLLETLKRLV